MAGDKRKTKKMTKKTFNIYYTDPETGEEVVVMKSFSDIETISAKEWAEDWAYTVADKGHYEVEER